MNIREKILDMLERTIEKNDYMSLVSIQLRIKTGYYEEYAQADAKKDVKFLRQYQKSYPHISNQIEQVIDYLDTLDVSNELEKASEN